MISVKCPICGNEIDPVLAEKIGLDSGSAEMLREKASSGKLVTLVQLGSVAEKYLKPETLGLEAQFWKCVNTLMEKQQTLVKEISEAKEGERTEIIKRYEEELARSSKELEKLQTEHKDTMKRVHDELSAIGKKIVGAGIGKVGELVTIKDLQSAFTSDDFTDKRSDEKGSDLIAQVQEGHETAGKVVVSVKYQDKWSGSFLEQLKRNLDEERTRWGMLVTRVFPSNALNDRAYMTKEGYFIVKPEYAVVAYYGLRQAVMVSWRAAQRARTVEERLRQERRIMEGLKEWISGDKFRQMTDTFDRAKEAAEDAQELVKKWQSYAQTQGDRVYGKLQAIIGELTESAQLLEELEEKMGKTTVAVSPKLVARKAGQRG